MTEVLGKIIGTSSLISWFSINVGPFSPNVVLIGPLFRQRTCGASSSVPDRSLAATSSNALESWSGLERPKVITAAVFNAEQIEGIPALEPERTDDWDPVEQAEKLLKASGAKIEHSQKGGAYYRLASDTIHLPSQERLATPSGYYAVVLHEIGHWTGHRDRLDPDLDNPFGSECYAREELRAEIASLIMGSKLGIGYDSAATPATSIIESSHWGSAVLLDSAEKAYFWDVMLDARWNLYYHARYR